MTKGRLEAFSDGVIAILITIMVLELKAPAGTRWPELRTWLSHDLPPYVLSFGFLGIYWNNHHHMLQATHRINGLVLWANLHLLFWLSLIPFATTWIRTGASLPAAAYGAVSLLAGLAYTLLQRSIIRADAANAKLAEAIGGDFKGYASLVLYVASIPLAYVDPRLSYGIFGCVAIMWFVPDRRIESTLKS
jgi:uncharacterized membrane protein